MLLDKAAERLLTVTANNSFGNMILVHKILEPYSDTALIEIVTSTRQSIDLHGQGTADRLCSSRHKDDNFFHFVSKIHITSSIRFVSIVSSVFYANPVRIIV
jgi:hypothetical protein